MPPLAGKHPYLPEAELVAMSKSLVYALVAAATAAEVVGRAVASSG